MAGPWRRAMVYLGLVDDEEYDEYADFDRYDDEGYEEPGREEPRREPARRAGARVTEPPADRTARVVRPIPRDAVDEPEVRVEPREPREERRAPEPAPTPRVARVARDERDETSRPSVIKTVPVSQSARVHIVEPDTFGDAQEVGDRLKGGQPVILNLQHLSKELQRRLIDFSSGLAYGVSGSMSRVADRVFLLTPPNVEVSDEEKERLQAKGLYEPS